MIKARHGSAHAPLAIGCAVAVGALICCQAFGAGDQEATATEVADAQAANDGTTLLEASNGFADAHDDGGPLSKVGDGGIDADAGLASASPRRVAFVTSDEMGGNLGQQPATWDLLCTSRANDAGVKGMFVAWISTPGSLAVTRLENQPLREWRDPKGTLITAGTSPIAAGGVALNIGITERSEAAPGGTSVWTGTFEDGGASPNNCNLWTAGSNANGDVGEIAGAGRTWTLRKTESCGSSNHIYCFEK